MRKLMLILALTIIMVGNAYAQVTGVSGQVLSEGDDQPVIGATVKVKGSTVATVTDAEGRFTLKGLSPADKEIEVSFIGYNTAFAKIQPDMKVYLEQASEMMDEVIVVAFGKQKRESFTGSASVVGATDIAKMQVTNPVEAINGRVTGVQMTDNTSTLTTSTPTIRVRGFSSINASNSPLIVLDGLPYNGYMSDINTADVESITVLKDAASNALYGARGANGVILITTKNARRGSTRVTLDAKWGVNTDGRVNYDVITDPGQYYEAYYMSLRNKYLYKDGKSASQAHMLANSTIGKPAEEEGLAYMVYNVPANQYLIGSNGKLNPNATLGNRVAYDNNIYMLYPDDWYKEGTRDGLRQEYNLNITGGNDQYSMAATVGYLDNEGLSYGSYQKRFSSRLKVNYQAYDFLRVGANAGYTNTNSAEIGFVWNLPYTVAPIYPLYIRDGNGNPLYDNHGVRYDYGNYDVGLLRPVEKNGNSVQDDHMNTYGISCNAYNMQGFATLDFLSDFHLTLNGSVYITESRWKDAYPGYYGYNVTTGGATSVYHYRTTDTNFQQLLNYSKQLGKHSIDVLLGHEYTRTLNTSLEGHKSNLADYEANTELDGAIVTTETGSDKSMYNVEGYFLRAQYDYESRYFLSGSFRRDGSSRFHPDHRWGNFWSLGAAWILTKEDWFPKSRLVNMLKVKASYGEQGNDGIGNYRYTDLYEIVNSNDEVALNLVSKGNPDITWETVGSFNLGLEFELFNNRLQGGVEYYYRKTRDMLMSLSVPYEMGYSSYYDNVGDMSNTGIELELNGDVIRTRDFTWNIGLNLTWQRNRILYIPEEKAGLEVDGHKGYSSGSYFYGEGLPIYSFYMKRAAGLNENGERLYWHREDDGTDVTTTKYDEASYYICGNPLPKVFGGFSTSFNIRNFDLSAQFNYSIGGKKKDSGYQFLTQAPTTIHVGSGIHKDVLASWTPENTSASLPLYYYGDTNSGLTTDFFLTDASYLTFRNLSVGYNFPKSLTSKLRMQRLRVFALGENLCYWTKRKGFDPRSGITGASYGDASPLRTISGGVQIQF